VTLDELEQCVHLLLTFAKEWGVTEVVPPDRDLYWTIGSPDWLAIYEEPKAVVGSLDDDEAELRKVLANPSRATSVDLQRVAHLLMVLAERVTRQAP
jgi:hypothetical protein